VLDHNAIDPAEQSLYRELAGGGATVRLLIPRRWHDNYRMRDGVSVPLQGGFETCVLPALLPTRTHRMVYVGIGRHLREFRPDIVYVNAEPENAAAAQCALLARAHPGTALVFSTWRNVDHHLVGYPYRLQALHRAAERTVLRRARHGVAFTREAPALFAAEGFAAVSYIPPPVDTDLFRPERSRPAREEGAFTVGYAGRLHRLKGVDVLLQATALLPGNVRLLVVGSGPETGNLRRKCRALGIGDRVEWRDPVAKTAMPGVLRAMDVVVLPSLTGRLWKEQFGRVIAEAMACGVPVIGSDSGALPYVLGGAGPVVPEGDADALRAAILDIRDDAEKREGSIARGIERVGREYALRVVAPKYDQLFRDLLGSPGALEV